MIIGANDCQKKWERSQVMAYDDAEHYMIAKVKGPGEAQFGISIRVLFGHSAFLCFLFMSYWGPASPAAFDRPLPSALLDHNLRLIMLASSFAALLAISFMRQSYFSDKGRVTMAVCTLILSIIAAMLPLVFAGMEQALYCGWLITGIVQALLIVLYNRRLAEFSYFQSLLTAVIAFVIASALFLVVSLLDQVAGYFALKLLLLLSILVICLEEREQLRQLSTDTSLPTIGVGAAGSSERKKIRSVGKRDLFAVANNTTIGFVGSLIAGMSPQPLFVILISLAGIASATLVYWLLFRIRLNLPQLFPHVFFLIATIALFALSLSESPDPRIIAIALFAFFVLFFCYSIIALATDSRSSMSERPIFPVPSVYDIGGLVCGYGIGNVALFYFAPDLGRLGLACFALVAVLALLAFLLFHKDSPNSKASAPARQPDSVMVAAMSDTTAEQSSSDNDRSLTQKAVFKNACDAIALEYRLTPREQEVFLYLTRGRNASFIQEQLTLSLHTVRCHIYNIYSKLGVHSKQELYRLIEAEINLQSAEVGAAGHWQRED
jgi:DNA-binding CsgD family transcriptional regulator